MAELEPVEAVEEIEDEAAVPEPTTVGHKPLY